jgi:predicted HTH domain antitoxin
MSILLKIPDSVTHAMRLPPSDRTRQLKVELAVSLYAQSILSFGKARELAGMHKTEFGKLLGKRGIARHYDEQDLEEDLNYAGGQ